MSERVGEWRDGGTVGRWEGWAGQRKGGTDDGWIICHVLPKMLVFQHVFLQHVVQARVCSSSDTTNSNKPGLVR